MNVSFNNNPSLNIFHSLEVSADLLEKKFSKIIDPESLNISMTDQFKLEAVAQNFERNALQANRAIQDIHLISIDVENKYRLFSQNIVENLYNQVSQANSNAFEFRAQLVQNKVNLIKNNPDNVSEVDMLKMQLMMVDIDQNLSIYTDIVNRIQRQRILFA